MSHSDLINHTVYQAIARPKSWLGADYYHTVLSVIIAGETFIMLNNPIYLLIFFPLHLVGIVLYKIDPYFYPILNTLGQTRFKAFRTSKAWGGNISYSQNVTRWARNKK